MFFWPFGPFFLQQYVDWPFRMSFPKCKYIRVVWCLPLCADPFDPPSYALRVLTFCVPKASCTLFHLVVIMTF
jgi:hypothetical protein